MKLALICRLKTQLKTFNQNDREQFFEPTIENLCSEYRRLSCELEDAEDLLKHRERELTELENMNKDSRKARNAKKSEFDAKKLKLFRLKETNKLNKDKLGFLRAETEILQENELDDVLHFENFEKVLETGAGYTENDYFIPADVTDQHNMAETINEYNVKFIQECDFVLKTRENSLAAPLHDELDELDSSNRSKELDFEDSYRVVFQECRIVSIKPVVWSTKGHFESRISF